MQIPRGTPCGGIGDACPVECPNCGCNFLTRENGSLPEGLEAFVDKCIEDKVIIPSQRAVAIQTFSTIEGCWKAIHFNHMTYLSREREERNVQHTLQTRIVELEAAVRDAQRSTISAVSAMAGTALSGIAASTPRGGGGVADSLTARGWGSSLLSPGERLRRAMQASHGVSDAELARAYEDPDLSNPGVMPRIGNGINGFGSARVSNGGITIIGGSANSTGVLAVGPGGQPITTSGPVLSNLDRALPTELAHTDPSDIMDLVNSVMARHPSALSSSGGNDGEQRG